MSIFFMMHGEQFPQTMCQWYKQFEFDIKCTLYTDLIKLHLKIVGNLLWKHKY